MAASESEPIVSNVARRVGRPKFEVGFMVVWLIVDGLKWWGYVVALSAFGTAHERATTEDQKFAGPTVMAARPSC